MIWTYYKLLTKQALSWKIGRTQNCSEWKCWQVVLVWNKLHRIFSIWCVRHESKHLYQFLVHYRCFPLKHMRVNTSVTWRNKMEFRDNGEKSQFASPPHKKGAPGETRPVHSWILTKNLTEKKDINLSENGESKSEHKRKCQGIISVAHTSVYWLSCQGLPPGSNEGDILMVIDPRQRVLVQNNWQISCPS